MANVLQKTCDHCGTPHYEPICAGCGYVRQPNDGNFISVEAGYPHPFADTVTEGPLEFCSDACLTTFWTKQVEHLQERGYHAYDARRDNFGLVSPSVAAAESGAGEPRP